MLVYAVCVCVDPTMQHVYTCGETISVEGCPILIRVSLIRLL